MENDNNDEENLEIIDNLNDTIIKKDVIIKEKNGEIIKLIDNIEKNISMSEKNLIH